MDQDLKAYLKLAFFAFCLAFFFLLLRSFIFGEAGRYRDLSAGNRHYVFDTATGIIYDPMGNFLSKPNKWDAFWGKGRGQ